MLEFQRQYTCCKCKFKIIVQADLEQRYIIVPPTICTNPEKCTGTTFITDENLDCTDNCKDYQEIKIQVSVRIIINLLAVTLINKNHYVYLRHNRFKN